MRAAVTIIMLAFALGGLAAADPAPTGNDVVIGEYKLDRIVDGDTVRVKGLDSSLRLLGIDTEETFKHDKERRAYANGWASYTKAARGSSPRPAKFATPLGDEAKRWAEAWFKDVTTVRLERDDPHEVKDRYRRYLAYVFAEKQGKWLDYNVEAVRAGMSPYFPKYGRSRRFDREFVAAEAEAKAAKRGIWAPGAEAYPDYPEREAWWTARGDFVAKFHDEAVRRETRATARDAKRVTMIDLTHDDAPAVLEANVGCDVSVLGTVGQIDRGDAPSHKTHSRHRAGKGRTHDAHSEDARGEDSGTEDARANNDVADQDEFADGWAGDPDGIDESGGEVAKPPLAKSAKTKPATATPATPAKPVTPTEGEPDDATGTAAAGAGGSRPHGKGPTRVILDNHIPLVVFDPEVLAASGIEAWKGEWIRVTGKPSIYHGRVEIVIDRTGQIELCPVPGLTKPSNREKSVPIHAP